MGDLRDRLTLLHAQIESARSVLDLLLSSALLFDSSHTTIWPLLCPSLQPVALGLAGLAQEQVSPALKSSAARAAAYWPTVSQQADLKSVLVLSALWAAVLVPLEAELRSDQEALREAAEVAFAHLKRSIVVDQDVQRKWAAALAAGEVHCERQGAVHLLHHRLWAFKATAAGGYTDLVVGDPITSVDESELRSAKGLVLTEWKVATPTDLSKKLAHARTQLDLYQEQALAAVELRRVQYVVVVSSDRLPMPDDEFNGRMRRRFINIPVAPSTASRAKTS